MEIIDATKDDIKLCAEIMAASDPWKAFKYSVDECVPKIASGKWLKLAKHEGKIIGFISYKPEGIAAMSYISFLCIVPEYRGQGIGAKLLKYAEDHIFSYDHNALLFVTSFNTDAIRFYEKSGYVKVGEITDYNFKGAHEYLYRKTIGPRRQGLNTSG